MHGCYAFGLWPCHAPTDVYESYDFGCACESHERLSGCVAFSSWETRSGKNYERRLRMRRMKRTGCWKS